MINKVTPEMVKKMFPGTPIVNIKTYLPYVLEALGEVGLTDKEMVLMALATIRAETAGFEPISEFKSKHNTSPKGHPFDLYDNREDLGNRGRPDGSAYRGRGFVQITGRNNYRKYGDKLGLDLETNPDLANQPDVAARLLALFLDERKHRIRTALSRGDFRAARKLVNGGSHGLSLFTKTYKIGDEILSEEA